MASPFGCRYGQRDQLGLGDKPRRSRVAHRTPGSARHDGQRTVNGSVAIVFAEQSQQDMPPCFGSHHGLPQERQ